MKYYLLMSFLLTQIFLCTAQWRYPDTKTVDSADVYFSKTYPDKYRWLENLNDSGVQLWYKKQAHFTDSLIAKIAGRTELLSEWEKLEKLRPTRYSGRYIYGKKIFYLKTLQNEDLPKLYLKENENGEERLIFDPAVSLPDKAAKFQSAIPSYDGRKFLITYVKGGSEISYIAVFDLATKAFLPEIIYPCLSGGEHWCMDNKTFIYTSLTTDDNKSPGFLKNNRVKLHQCGTDTAADKDYFSKPAFPELQLEPQNLVYGDISYRAPNSIFASVYNDDGLNVYYCAPASQLRDNHIAWKVLSSKKDQLVSSTEFAGDNVYAITSKNTANYKLVVTPISNPDWDHAEIIAPERKDLVLDAFTLCKDYILITYGDGINKRLFKYDLRSKMTSEIPLPYPGTLFVQCLDPQTNTCYVNLTSWNKPLTEFKLDAKTNSFAKSDFNLPAEYSGEYKNIDVQEVEVKGHDGVMIPLSIIYKKGLKLDGSAICFMESYGAYGYSMLPIFNNLWNSLVVRGIVVAIPHVRGGGEKGEAWQKAGMKKTKPNTWKDFNNCAEYLIRNKFTSAKKIVGSGASAGGIMISRAVTERPDLYGAAISNVGVLNTLRSEWMPNGPNLAYHFGTVKDSVECDALYEMDGLAHVQPNTAYPAFICVTGWNDPRVSSWQSAKFVSALQKATVSGKPVLLKVNYESGHFGSLKDFSEFWSFALWQCGHPDFGLDK